MDRTLLLSLAGISLGLLGLVLALSAHRRLSSARRSLALLQGSYEGRTLVDAVASYADYVKDVEADVVSLGQRQDELFALLGRSKRNLGVVRYDAFDDMGGRLSFSAALVDDHGDGLVITAINSRSEARVYAKPLEGGNSDHNLSKEEEAAIADALGSRSRLSGSRKGGRG